ncbi:MAG: hypothetical protein WBW33_28710 [Bryobacteraceae bacterium]
MPKRLLTSLISLGLTLLLGILAGCGSDIKTRDHVQSDLRTHLQKVGLDVDRLDVSVTAVAFDKNTAHATVTFSPKGAANVHDGITMNYTLEAKDGHWVVVGRADSQGHGMGGPSSNPNLPAGHPPMGPGTPFGDPKMPSQQQPLPPGHPQVQGTPSPSNGQALPPGHPKV